MNTHGVAGGIGRNDESDSISDVDRMESMKELLTDLRTSIQMQRHLITVSRELLDRS